MGFYHQCRKCAGKVRFDKEQDENNLAIYCDNCRKAMKLNEIEAAEAVDRNRQQINAQKAAAKKEPEGRKK